MAPAAALTGSGTQQESRKLSPPSPVRSILAGSLAGGIEIGEYLGSVVLSLRTRCAEWECSDEWWSALG